MTETDLIDRLKLEAEQESRSAVARRYRFSLTYIANVLDGRTPPSARLAEAMGFKRVVRFERINGQ